MASIFIPRSVQNKGKIKRKDRSLLKSKHLQTSKKDTEEKCEVLPCQQDSQNIKIFPKNRDQITSNDIDNDSASALTETQTTSKHGDSCTEIFVSDEEDEEVVSFSKNQRWPAPGEPVCIMCGKYGAYICDQTDKDVCSLECKAKHLHLEAKKSKTKEDSRNIINEINIQDREEVRCQHHLHTSFDADGAKIFERKENSFPCGLHFTYTIHPTILSLTENQVQQLRSKTEIQVKGENIPNPILEFEHCQFHETLASNLRNSGYQTPTPVQMQVIPIGLQGRDVMACAQTGSGKTAAFLLPMITRIHHEIGQLELDCQSSASPYGLVLAPTRELCMQIENQAKELMKGLQHMRTALIVGGLPLPPQLHRLKTGVQVIVATPGRLLELLNKVDVELSHVKILVLDEVDTMLQLGFEGQVKQIIQQLPTQRQTMFFSATIPASIDKMAEQLLSSPVFVSVGLPSTPNTAIKQIVLWVEDKSKKKRLFSILKDPKHFKPPLVVFVDSKMGADLLAEAIEKTCDISCVSMHGDKSQEDRSRILQSFLAGVYPVIVCTGVLGRGIDLVNVKQVINFDMPSTIEEYVHQIGRAGRLGSTGWALTFINSSNKNVFLDLVSTLEPLGVNLPAELVNSPYLHQQRQKKEGRRNKRKHRDEFVTQDNLMDLLKKSAFRRRR